MSRYTIDIKPANDTVTLSPAEWQVILSFARHKDFGMLINNLRQQHNMEIKYIESILLSMQKKGIVKLTQLQPDKEAVNGKVPDKFWETINIELSKSIGPIASIIIDDSIEEFNCSKNAFPIELLFSFIEKTANQISSPEDKSQFQKNMLTFIKQNI